MRDRTVEVRALEATGPVRPAIGTPRAAGASRLLARSFVTFSSRALGRVAGAVSLVVLARLLPLGDFAAYAYVVGLVTVVVVVGDSGVPLLVSREIAAGRSAAAAAFWAAAPVVLVGAALVACALTAIGALDSAPGSAGVALALAAAIAATRGLFTFVAAALRGMGKLELEAALQLGGSLAFAGGAVAAAVAGGGVAAVLGVLLAKEVCVLLLAAGAAAAAGVGRPSRVAGARSLLRRGIPIGAGTAALAALTQTPLLVLGNTGPAASVAHFAAPFRLADAAFFLAVAAGFSLLPGLSRAAAADPSAAKQLVWRATVGAAALGVVLVPLARPATEVLFGARFAGAEAPALILAAGLPAYAAAGLGWYALLALGRDALALRLALGAGAASILASGALVPAYGAVGAAVAYATAVGSLAAGVVVALARDRP